MKVTKTKRFVTVKYAKCFQQPCRNAKELLRISLLYINITDLLFTRVIVVVVIELVNFRPLLIEKDKCLYSRGSRG